MGNEEEEEEETELERRRKASQERLLAAMNGEAIVTSKIPTPRDRRSVGSTFEHLGATAAFQVAMGAGRRGSVDRSDKGLEEAFRRVDTDRSGKISIAEMTAHIKDVLGEGLDPRKIEDMVAEADTNHGAIPTCNSNPETSRRALAVHLTPSVCEDRRRGGLRGVLRHHAGRERAAAGAPVARRVAVALA